MREIREEIVETPAPVVVEEQIVPAPRRTIRHFFRREPVVRDVVSTEYYTAPAYSHDPTLAGFLRIAWFALGVLEGLMALRFILALLGANPSNAFAALIYGLTGPFVLPFRTLFATPAESGSVVELYTLIAMLIYFLAWWTFVKLVGVVSNRPVDV